jgi:FAD/FMN-containing dehydrogenase
MIQIAPTSDSGNEVVAVGLKPPGIDEACILASVISFQSSVEAALAALEPVNITHPPGAILEIINEPTSIAKEYSLQADSNPLGHRYCSENAYIDNSADVTAVLEKAFTTLPSPKSFALWFSMNPTSQRPLPDMALSMHSDHYFALYTLWEDSKDDERCRTWVADVMKDVAPMSVGAYMGDSDFQQRRTKYWSDENAEKLMGLRRKFDPKGVVCGYLDEGDTSRTAGLDNKEWISSKLV